MAPSDYDLGGQSVILVVEVSAHMVPKKRQLIPLIVMAFQGLSSGDPNRDAQPMRFIVHEGLPVVLVQSFDAVS